MHSTVPHWPCPEQLHLTLLGAIPSALADALEQSSVGLQVTCRASPDTNPPAGGHLLSPFSTCALVWCAAFAVGMAGGAHRARALRCGGARRNVLKHRPAARSGVAPAIPAASLAAPACGARSARAGTLARVCACQRDGRACVLTPTPLRAGFTGCRGALP